MKRSFAPLNRRNKKETGSLLCAGGYKGEDSVKLTTVLFDLDGTLLPMDQEMFIKAYFGRLAKKLAPHGYDPDKLIKGIYAGIEAMVRNDGSCRNEDAFWKTFCMLCGEKAVLDKPLFEDFYKNEFQQVKESCGFAPEAAPLVKKLKDRGLRVVLATNPLFPAVATESRIRWAGLAPSDFEWVTTYENSSFCKPNPAYYEEILDKLGLEAGECVMVGNDVQEDGAAASLGMSVFILTNCLIDRKGKHEFPCGGFEELEAFIAGL